MQLIDYTHPDRVPSLKLPINRRSPKFYLRLDELEYGHPYFSRDWALFRHPEWLEGGSAWVQAQAIFEDMQALVVERAFTGELRPVVGSNDQGFDEALAQALKTLGLRPMVAEVLPRPAA